MPFDILKPVSKKEKEKLMKRITQRNLIPKAVRLRNSEIYRLGEETIILYDNDGEEVLRINQDDNRLEFGDPAYYIDYLTGDAYFNSISGTGILQNLWHASLIPQWQNSWTVAGAYEDVAGSLFYIDFSNFSGWNFKFEMMGKTDAGTGYYHIYDITNTAVITGSEITTTSTTEERIVSGNLTVPSGAAELKIQHKIVGGDEATEFVNSQIAKLIIELA
jgi:hypothetical protein